MPFIITTSSMTSLVVPGIFETIALSSFNKAFSKVDFPTLGFPTIATGTPFLITLPYSKEPIKFLIFNFMFDKSSLPSL